MQSGYKYISRRELEMMDEIFSYLVGFACTYFKFNGILLDNFKDGRIWLIYGVEDGWSLWLRPYKRHGGKIL